MLCDSCFSVDNTPPAVICPEDVLLTILTGIGGSEITWKEPKVNDNSGNPFLKEQSHVSGEYFEVGTTVVTYSFADFSENEGSCSFTVRINEGEWFRIDLKSSTILIPILMFQHPLITAHKHHFQFKI